jgi:hypothetical protein
MGTRSTVAVAFFILFLPALPDHETQSEGASLKTISGLAAEAEGCSVQDGLMRSAGELNYR